MQPQIAIGIGVFAASLLTVVAWRWARGFRQPGIFVTRRAVLTDAIRDEINSIGSLEKIVDFAILLLTRQASEREIEQAIVRQFRVSKDTAFYLLECIESGIGRAAAVSVGREEFRPDPHDSPIRFMSFQRAISDPSIVQRAFPEIKKLARCPGE